MKKINCLIVDDELPALELLEAYIKKLPQLHLVTTCENGIAAISALANENIDLMFLDIEMPDLTGLELLKSLKIKPEVILTTAYREFAVEGFVHDVCDYLVKPFSFERFVQAINKTSKRQAFSNNSYTNNKNILEDSFFVKSSHKLEKLIYGDILYIESMREYVSIHTANKRYVLHQSMNKMVEKLPADYFMRVHRSFIVSLHQIQAINGNQIQIGDKKIPIGASFRKVFFEKIELL